MEVESLKSGKAVGDLEYASKDPSGTVNPLSGCLPITNTPDPTAAYPGETVTWAVVLSTRAPQGTILNIECSPNDAFSFCPGDMTLNNGEQVVTFATIVNPKYQGDAAAVCVRTNGTGSWLCSGLIVYQ